MPLAAKSKEIAAGREDRGGERRREGAATKLAESGGEREQWPRGNRPAARGSDGAAESYRLTPSCRRVDISERDLTGRSISSP